MLEARVRCVSGLSARSIRAVPTFPGLPDDADPADLVKCLLHGSSHAALLLDSDGMITYWSEGAETATGLLCRDTVRKSWSTILFPAPTAKQDDCPLPESPLEIAYKTGGAAEGAMTILKRDREQAPVIVTATPLRASSGDITAVLATWVDDVKRTRRPDLKGHLSDGGLRASERRILPTWYSKVCAQRRRPHRGSLFLFLVFRGTAEHASWGDKLCRITKKRLRSADFVSPYGRTSLLVVLSNACLQDGLKIANRCRDVAFEVLTPAGEDSLGCSITMTELPGGASPLATLENARAILTGQGPTRPCAGPGERG